jgi:hypothetical protein
MSGPVELLVLTFTSAIADPAVAQGIADVVATGDVTILDLVLLARDDSGDLAVVDLEDEIDAHGFGRLAVERVALISDEDLDVVRDALAPDSSAAVIVFEHTWVARVSESVARAGGEVGLHVRIPVADVESALAAAADDVA